VKCEATMAFLGSGASTPAAAALYLCALTHTYILFNVVPYAGYMAVELLSHSSSSSSENALTSDSVGFYAGLLGTSFALGRAFGFAPWRYVRSSLGEKGSLIASLVLSASFSALFGLSSTFAGALLARFFLGLSNGISGAVKRAALDIARSNGGEDEAEKAPARILSVMSWGCVVGPALGGALSNPLAGVTTTTTNAVAPDGGWWGDAAGTWLEGRPFLLPNIFGALLCLLSAAMVWAFVQDGASEKRPALSATVGKLFSMATKQQSRAEDDSVDRESQPLLPSLAVGDQNTLPSYVEGDKEPSRRKEPPSAMADIWKGEQARRHLIAYWSFSFAAVCIDEALPLFLIARLGGTGLPARSVGSVLGGAGLILVLCQRCTFESLLLRAGMYRSKRIAAALGTIPAFLVPLSLKLNGGTCASLMASSLQPMSWSSGESERSSCDLLAPSAFAFLILLAGSLKVFSALYFAVGGMATGRTVPPTHRDEAARIMTLGALCTRSVAPTVAGALVSFSMSPSSVAPWNPKYGSVAVWSVLGLVMGVCVTALAFTLSEASSGLSLASPGVKDRRSKYLTQRQRAEVYVKLWEVHYDKGSETTGAKWRRVARKVIALNRIKTGSPPKKGAMRTDALRYPFTVDAEPPTTELTGVSPQSRHTSWADRMLRTGINPDLLPFVILGTHKDDKSCKPHVLSPPLMDALHSQLPHSCSDANFWLRYSLVRDGASIETLANKVSTSRYTILAIETMDGDVFGSFNSQPWQKTDKYVGGGQSFLWRMKKQRSFGANSESIEAEADRESDIEVFHWTGENDLCQLMSDARIAVGGGLVVGGDGFGLVIEDDLSRGSSSSCVTYGNPCLCPGSENGRFEVANVEIWSMTSFLLLADAERSERNAKIIQDNIAAEGAWSNYF